MIYLYEKIYKRVHYSVIILNRNFGRSW